MASPIWWVEFTKKMFPHLDSFAKATKVPVLGTVIELVLFNDDKVYYVPEDKVIQINEKLKPESMVLPSQVAQHFIQKSKYRRIMND